ncbi:MAG: hypothetical protein U0Z44_02035 [Kouleothrix sp.]
MITGINSIDRPDRHAGHRHRKHGTACAPRRISLSSVMARTRRLQCLITNRLMAAVWELTFWFGNNGYADRAEPSTTTASMLFIPLTWRQNGIMAEQKYGAGNA